MGANHFTRISGGMLHVPVRVFHDHPDQADKRMSGSPIVTDANDFDFTINDEAGQLVQVGLYNTMLVGAIDLAITWTLQNRADNPGIEEGDMFLCNDPWVGGGLHQNDVVVFQPIFYEGKLFAWTSAVCHQPDLGGSVIGSAPIGDVDVFSESLPTPPVKIIRDGQMQRDVADLWVRRSRVPMIIGLDLHAKVGANTIGRNRLTEVINQYGPDVVKAVMKRMMNDAEHRLRHKLAALPDGIWSAVGYQDQAFLGDRRTHKVAVTMSKRHDHLIFDFTGTDPQAGVISCTLGGCRGGIMHAFLPILCGDIPWSASGLMRCFDVIAPEGTLVNATYPAAVNRAPLGTGWMIGNLVSQCLAQMLDRSIDYKSNVQATCCGTFDFGCVAGVDERGPEPVPFLNVVMETVAGGYGARPDRDGINTGGSFCIPMGRVPDAEITELLYPLLVLWRREEQDTGGPGRHRGGTSCAVAMTPHGTSLPAHVLLASSGKASAQNPGLAGGYPGSLGHEVIVHGAHALDMLASGRMPTRLCDLPGDAEISQCFAQSVISPGDVLYMNCQGGGGYGDPLLRNPVSVAQDVGDGLVSVAAARQSYAVVLTADGQVDEVATDQLRAERRAERQRAMVADAILVERIDPAAGQPLDDNLVCITTPNGTKTGCRHCGQVLAGEDNVLHLAQITAPSSTAGPQVRTDPSHFIDAPVVFRQFVCPGCAVAVHSSIGPDVPLEVINGYAVAH